MKKMKKFSIAFLFAVSLAVVATKSATASSWYCDELMPWGSNTWVCTLDGSSLWFVDCRSGSCVYMQI